VSDILGRLILAFMQKCLLMKLFGGGVASIR